MNDVLFHTMEAKIDFIYVCSIITACMVFLVGINLRENVRALREETRTKTHKETAVVPSLDPQPYSV